MEDESDIIVINVGGVRFETYRQTLSKNDCTRLSDEQFLARFFISSRGEYFFDRDPDIFKATLNYMRTGLLHLPSFICGPAAKVELEFWGVPQQKIEQCCWINYNEWNSTQEALKRLEKDRKVTLMHPDVTHPNATCWTRLRPIVWRFMNRSNSSIGAKIFGVVSLMFVVVSIFSFMAETTEPFEYYVTNDVIMDYDTYMADTNITSQVANSTANNNTETVDLPPVSSPSKPSTTTAPDYSDYEEANSRVRIKHPVLQMIDLICLVYFVLEYVARFVFSPKKLKHATSLLSVIDFLAILPDLIEFVVYYALPSIKGDMDAVNYITVIRVIRVLRIFRLVRHSAGLWILIYTLRASFSELMLLFWFMGLGILVFSSLIYYVDDRDSFKSIPNGFWWALITMTTVGYGDMYPTTTLGKVVGSLCAMAGVLMIGFTVPALVNNFMLYYRHVQFAMNVEEYEKSVMKENKKAEKNKHNRLNGATVKESDLNGPDHSEKVQLCNEKTA